MEALSSDQNAHSSAARLARLANELKITALAQGAVLMALYDPRLPLLTVSLEMLDAPTDGDLPLRLPSDDEQDTLTFSLREVLQRVGQLAETTVRQDLMSSSMMMGALRIGDSIKRTGLHRSNVPLLEFARHFRNACGHGDRWTFRGPEPRFPAATDRLKVERSWNGRRATWETVSTRGYIDFLDEIHIYFRQVALHRAISTAFDEADGEPLDVVRHALSGQLTNYAVPIEDHHLLAGIVEAISSGHLPAALPTVPPIQYTIC